MWCEWFRSTWPFLWLLLLFRDLKGQQEAFPTEHRLDDILRLRIPDPSCQFSRASLPNPVWLSSYLTVPLQNRNSHVLGRQTKHTTHWTGTIHTVCVLRDNFDPLKRNLRQTSYLKAAGRDFLWCTTTEWDQSPHTKLHGFFLQPMGHEEGLGETTDLWHSTDSLTSACDRLSQVSLVESLCLT